MKRFCFFIGTDRHHEEVLIFRQAKTLIENGFDVSYIVSDDEPEETLNGIRVVPNGAKRKGYLGRIIITPFLSYRTAKELNADVYQTTSLDQLVVGLGLKRKGKRVIFHLREGHPYTFKRKSKLPKWLTMLLVNLMVVWMKFVLRRYDSVITVSDDIANYLREWGLDNVWVQGNYPIINPRHEITFEDYCSRENRILYFGSIYSISCQEYLLDALMKTKNVHYLLAGKFWSNNTYYEQLKKHPKWADVEFIDGFSHEELYSFFDRSTICNVLRDFSKTQSPNGSLGIIKIFESMEAALPIICSDVPIYRKMMEEYKCGILVDPKDSKQIAEAIDYLISHKEEAYQMGQEGRKAVIEKYSWNALSKEYMEIVDGSNNKTK